jgi:uncharacterized SAM-binding protein YcdF (DUF218 family)
MFYFASKVVWFFATPSNALPFLILAGLLLAGWRRARRFGYGLALAGALLLLFAGLSPLANWTMLPLEDRFPVFRDDGGPVTGVIVLGGAAQAEESFAHDQLTANEAGERLIALGALARRYPKAKLVFSGGGASLFVQVRAESDAVRHFAATLGIDRTRLIVEDQSRTTAENAIYSRRLVDPKPGERWLLVTSAYHMPRAMGCFRKAGFPTVAYPVDFRLRGAADVARTFDFISEGLRRLDTASKEWAGLLAYWFAGYIDDPFPAPSPAAPGASASL